MNAIRRSGILALILLALTLPLAGWNRHAEPDKSMSVEEIRTMLKDGNFKFEEGDEKDEDGKTYFLINVGDEDDEDGLQAALMQYGGKGDSATSFDISISVQVDSPKLADMNKWNAEERYAKAYIADTDTVTLEEDLDIAAGVSKDVVKKFIKDFIEMVPEFLKGIEK